MDKQKKVLIISTIAILSLATLIGIRLINMTGSQEISNTTTNGMVDNAKEEANQLLEDGIIDTAKDDTEKDREGQEEKSEKDTMEEDTEESLEDEKEDKDREEDKESADSQSNEIYIFKDKYVVKESETLSNIAARCLDINGLEVNYVHVNHAKELITKINDIQDPNMILVGSELMLPTKKSFDGMIPEGISYEVKEGDTLYGIVKSYMSWCADSDEGVKLIMTNNKMNTAQELQAGTIIYIPDETDLEV